MLSRVRSSATVVVAVCAVTLLVGWWTKARCLTDGDWDSLEQYRGWCYTDVYPLWFAERLNEQAVPYLDHPVEYPVLIGAQMLVAAVPLWLVGGGAVGFYHLTAAVSSVFVFDTVRRLRAMGVPDHRVLWFAAAPTLAIFAFLNWDPLVVALSVAAIQFHRAGRDTAAGIAAGLGTAAKLYPAFLVPIIVLARWAQGRRNDALRTATAALAAWIAVNLPVALVAREGWARFFQLNRERGANFDSLWFLVQQVRDASLPLPALNTMASGLFLVGAVAIVVVGRRLHPPEEQWRLFLPVLIWFLLTNKVYSPQYSLWLLPLLPLGLPRAAPFAAFAVADLLVWGVEFPFLAEVVDGRVEQAYPALAFTLVVRAALLVLLLVESLRPAAARPTGGTAPIATAPSAVVP